ncbi:MAG: hypothetical protein Q7S32_02390 [bacterium]|nr:hypothetical protein [bacterium]
MTIRLSKSEDEQERVEAWIGNLEREVAQLEHQRDTLGSNQKITTVCGGKFSPEEMVNIVRSLNNQIASIKEELSRVRALLKQADSS